MGMTMTEKIVARAAGRSHVTPGENVWVDVDLLMTHDVCGPGTIGVFKKEFGASAKVWDKEKIVLIPDHYIFTADERANRNVDILRDFAQEQEIKYFYDITDRSNFKANPDYKGVCHIALAQEDILAPVRFYLVLILTPATPEPLGSSPPELATPMQLSLWEPGNY
jgi:3-isopropylmalate/(R)-2-methylmalate dehydratase large subunit